MSSMMRAWTLHGLPELVAQLGGDVSEVLNQFGISRRQLESDDATLPSPTFIKLLEYCAQALNCPDFGLRLGLQIGPEALGPVVMMARHCESAGEAAGEIARYLHLYIPAVKLELSTLNSDTKRIGFHFLETRVGAMRQFEEWCMGISIRNFELLVGTSSKPHAVFFSHSPLMELSHYKKLMGCSVYFGEEFTSLDIHQRDFIKPLTQNDPQLKQILADYLNKTMISGNATLEDQIYASIRSLLPTGRCKIKVVADQYSISLRTLQRRLDKEQLNFSNMVDDIRQELLSIYLNEPNLQLTQVAALLGYSEQSSLTHACQRWFGAAPNELRATGIPS